MLYKTIVLRLIEDLPDLRRRLREDRSLRDAIDAHAVELKTSHEAWKELIARKRPDSDSTQIASEALERAVSETRSRLRSASADHDA